MDHFISIDDRYVPLHAISHIDDSSEQVLIVVRDAQTGPGDYRLQGEAAEEFRGWLKQHVAVSVASENEPQDTGTREDD